LIILYYNEKARLFDGVLFRFLDVSFGSRLKVED